MPALASGQVVAGHSGLDNEVRWVHIVDIPDAHYEWRRQHVLLLTAGFGLRDDPDRQAALVPKLVEQGFAGMILSTGHYFEHMPQVILDAANEHGFPVIEVPRELLFIEITEAILNEIVNQQYGLLRQSTRIHEKLTELVLQGGNLDALASTISSLLKRSITIEDTSLRVLAAAQHGSVDEARQRSVRSGRTTPEVAQRLADRGVYDQLQAQMTPIHLPAIPELEMTMERVVAPIIVDREIYGYIWIIAGDHPLTELDELAIMGGATVAALILFKEQAVREAEQSFKGDFLRQLLEDAPRTTAFMEQARRLNYRPERSHQVILLQNDPTYGVNNHLFENAVRDNLGQHERHSLMVWRENALVLVIESEDSQTGKQLAESLSESLSAPFQQLMIGVGGVGGAGSEDRRLNSSKARSKEDASGEVVHSFENAREAIDIGLVLGQTQSVFTFRDLGVLHWLYNLPEEIRLQNPFLDHINTLAEYDVERDAELVDTLEAYLDHGGSLVKASEVLHVHRNTLLHRLERIEELISVDLRDPIQSLNLHVAMKSYQLHG